MRQFIYSTDFQTLNYFIVNIYLSACGPIWTLGTFVNKSWHTLCITSISNSFRLGAFNYAVLSMYNQCMWRLSPFTYVVCCAYLMLDLTHLVHRPVRRSTQHGLCGNIGLIAVRSSGTYTLIASWVFGVLIKPFYFIVVTEMTSILDLPRGKDTCGLHI